MNPKILTPAFVRRLIPPRPIESNKGKNGHVLLVAGSRGMAGAAILCGLGALKSGAGLLTIALPKSLRRIASPRLPEAMTLALPETKGGWITQQAGQVIKAYARRRTVNTFAVGPGLSVHPSVGKVIKMLINSQFPMVLDADGLNNLRIKDLRGSNSIVTPHPGEMATLLGIKIPTVQKDRVGLCKDTAKNFGIICVLKGHETVISNGFETVINQTGNQAMATGGMGDILTGIIAGFLAQGLSRFDAACAGVYIHGLAGDLAAKADRGLLATELAGHIPEAIAKAVGRA